MSNMDFVGTYTALVTPFRDDGAIDWAAFDRLVEGQITAKDSGIVPCGKTRESPTLDHNQQLEVVKRSLEHSLNFGIYHDEALVGFGRVITDYATFGYVGDVFVLDAHRGRGLSKWLMECMVGHPDLQGFRRWVLLTRDAHGLYRQFGFTPIARPDRYMERWAPEVYKAPKP